MQHHDQQDPNTMVQVYSPFQSMILTILKWGAYAAAFIAMMYIMHSHQ
ncbi:hypothetical protein SCACP_28190 [Sporomusa carbonis]